MQPITVFWRPGCPFCSGLLGDLDRMGVDYATRNIWDDEDAAALVRSAANGNETVPTVSVGDQFLVNPPAAHVVAVASK